MPTPNNNGQAATEVVDDSAAPVTGQAYPLNRVPPQVMIRRDVVVAGSIGFLAGVGLVLGVLYICQGKSRG